MQQEIKEWNNKNNKTISINKLFGLTKLNYLEILQLVPHNGTRNLIENI